MRISLLFFAAALAAPATAELYQWKDEQGRTHYSDRKPAGTQVRTLPQKQSSASDNASSPTDDSQARKERQRRLADVLRKEDEEREAESRRKAAETAARQQECRKLRQHLQSIEGRRVYEEGESGERIFLDDTTRDARVREMQQSLAEHCS